MEKRAIWAEKAVTRCTVDPSGDGICGADVDDRRTIRAKRILASSRGARVIGWAVKCTNPDCSTYAEIDTLQLGNIRVAQRKTLRLEWDSAGENFIHTMPRGEPVSIPYAGFVCTASDPAVYWKRLELNQNVENCDDGERRVGFGEVRVSNVRVNETP
jgi:hypothetical protein